MTLQNTSDSNGHQQAAGSSTKEVRESVLSEPSIATTESTITRRRISERLVDADEGRDNTPNDFDEDDRMPSRKVIFVLFTHNFLIALSFSIIIPTSRQYAESLGASDGFSGLTVGTVGFAAAFITPLYRLFLKRSYAGCLYFQVAMMQIGGVMYSLAQLAKTMWMMLVARMFTGSGAGLYPVVQYIAEHVGKNHRSSVTSLTIGIARAIGLAMGPILAAILVYIDFNIGELQVNKETNAGWTAAIFCMIQGLLVFLYFPKHGSQVLQERVRTRRLPEHNSNVPPVPLKERVLYYCAILNTIFFFLVSTTFISACEVAVTKVVQTRFNWSIQNSALLVGGFVLTTIPTLLMLGKLSYKYDDRTILIGCLIVNMCGVMLMFEYGKPMNIIPYLVGGFFSMNSAFGISIFSIALSSKITSLRDLETVQAYMNMLGLLIRGAGAVIGDLLRPNYLATVFISLSVTSFLATLLLYKRLVPSRQGV